MPFRFVSTPAARPRTAPPSTWAAYHRATRTATYGFVSALPLLVLYEALLLVAGGGQPGGVRVGADVWIGQVLAVFGGARPLVLAVAVGLAGVAAIAYDRPRRPPLRLRYFGWMVAESAGYAVLLAALVAGVVGALFAAATPALEIQTLGLWTRLALSVGAGLYEELLFRVLIVGGLYWALRRALPRRRGAYLTAALIGALIFSAVHYVGVYGDVFTLASFTFRFLFGLALNALFLWRGFGVAAWAHALYDVFLTLGFLG